MRKWWQLLRFFFFPVQRHQPSIFSFLFPFVFLHLISLYSLVLFSVVFVHSKVFFPTLFCSFLVVFIGAGGAGSTLPYLIMAYGERGHPTLPRCWVKWPIGSRLQCVTPLVSSSWGGVSCVGFWQCLGKWGERENEAGRNKRKKQKVSLPLLHIQGKKKMKSVA